VPLISGVTGFLDKYILGYALGVASGPALEPFVQDLANEAWTINQHLPLDAETVAAIVAEDVEQKPWGVDEASQTGVNESRFDALLGEALNAPGLDTLYQLWRRNEITTAEFEHGLRKAKLEARWDAPLEAIKETLLSPSDLAMARQQGFVDDSKQLAESQLQGVPPENATVLYELAGLPPGAAEAQSLLNRGLIDDAMFAQIIREGHTKTKYTDLLKSAAVYVLGPLNYVQGRLRGWITDAEMYAGTALTGVTRADTDLLFKIHGRPLSWHQVWIGLQRGGTYDGPIDAIDPAFLSALRQSDIRPEWYNLAWHQRYSYPSAFVMRALTQAGTITQAEAEQVLLYEGWEPTFAKTVTESWAGGTPSGGKEATKAELLDEFEGGYITQSELRDHLTALGYQGPELDLEVHLADARRIKSWRGKAETAINKAFLKGSVDEATARADLAELGLDADYIDRVIQIWQLEARL
jgi:hypothetical protein